MHVVRFVCYICGLFCTLHANSPLPWLVLYGLHQGVGLLPPLPHSRAHLGLSLSYLTWTRVIQYNIYSPKFDTRIRVTFVVKVVLYKLPSNSISLQTWIKIRYFVCEIYVPVPRPSVTIIDHFFIEQYSSHPFLNDTNYTIMQFCMHAFTSRVVTMRLMVLQLVTMYTCRTDCSLPCCGKCHRKMCQ